MANPAPLLSGFHHAPTAAASTLRPAFTIGRSRIRPFPIIPPGSDTRTDGRRRASGPRGLPVFVVGTDTPATARRAAPSVRSCVRSKPLWSTAPSVGSFAGILGPPALLSPTNKAVIVTGHIDRVRRVSAFGSHPDRPIRTRTRTRSTSSTTGQRPRRPRPRDRAQALSRLPGLTAFPPTQPNPFCAHAVRPAMWDSRPRLSMHRTQPLPSKSVLRRHPPSIVHAQRPAPPTRAGRVVLRCASMAGRRGGGDGGPAPDDGGTVGRGD
jgi:hypothetical protein